MSIFIQESAMDGIQENNDLPIQLQVTEACKEYNSYQRSRQNSGDILWLAKCFTKKRSKNILVCITI